MYEGGSKSSDEEEQKDEEKKDSNLDNPFNQLKQKL